MISDQCLYRERTGFCARWRATRLQQTPCCSWTGGTITQLQTLRCRRATGAATSGAS